MKKVLSVLLAGAMVASMSVAAFATNDVKEDTVYNNDGESIVGSDKDVYDTTPKVEFIKGEKTSLKLDGVVPGITMYVPLMQKMNDTVQGVFTPATSKPTGTSVKYYTEDAKAVYQAAYDGESEESKKVETGLAAIVDAKYSVDESNWTTAKYYSADDGELKPLNYTASKEYTVSLNSLTNKDYFKFDVDKEDGSKYVKKISVVEDKKFGKLDDRTAYLKIELNDSQTVDDLKSTGEITFKAKADSSTYTSGSKKLTNGDVWFSGNTFTINYTFWINNVKKQNDASIDTGDRVYFDPDSNEDNTLVWGDDRAALFFEGNDDAGKFYARLQTKADSEIYATYGDPVNADLWFFDFVGNPTVPSTSRATLTLGIPWDEDDDYTPRAEDCYIYEMDADGYLTDVTDRFTYDEENDGTTEIDGWTIKTRTLGTYVISDTELDVTVVDEVEEVEEDVTAPAEDDAKEIPNTGSSDMVGAAVVAAIASLAAAGAVAFKKASK